MKENKVINFISMVFAGFLTGGGLFLILDFFFHRVGEGIRIVDWLYLLLGIIFFLQGVLLNYQRFKKQNKKE